MKDYRWLKWWWLEIKSKMKGGLLVLLSLFFNLLQSQNYLDSIYTLPFGTNCIYATQHNEIVTIGLTVINGGSRYGILKIDSNGTVQIKNTWFIPFKAIYTGYAGSLSLSKGKYFHTGWSVDTNDLWRGVLTVWDENMNLVYDSEFGYQDSSSLFFSHTINNDKITCTGMNWLYQSGQQHRQLLLMQIDTAGNKLWEHSYPAKPGLWHLQGNTIIATQDGGFAIGGFAYNNGTLLETESYIIIVDSTGNKLKEKYLTNEENGNTSLNIHQKTNGNFIVTYSKGYYNNGSTNAIERSFVITIEELHKNTLETIWSRDFLPGHLNLRSTYRLIPQNDSTYLICGTYRPIQAQYQGQYADQVGYIFAITENGDSLWYRDYANGTSPREYNYLNDIAITPDGGIVGAGRLQTPNSPLTGGLANHVWLFKTDSIGCLYPGCDTVYHKPKPPVTEFKVYPNPAQGGQELFIEIPNATSATASVYNTSGQIILQAEIQFSNGIATLSPQNRFLKGLYVLHLQTDAGNNYVEKISFY